MMRSFSSEIIVTQAVDTVTVTWNGLQMYTARSLRSTLAQYCCHHVLNHRVALSVFDVLRGTLGINMIVSDLTCHTQIPVGGSNVQAFKLRVLRCTLDAISASIIVSVYSHDYILIYAPPFLLFIHNFTNPKCNDKSSHNNRAFSLKPSPIALEISLHPLEKHTNSFPNAP